MLTEEAASGHFWCLATPPRKPYKELMTVAAIAELYRYPVKGLSPEALTQASLRPGKTVSGDRSYAIENGPIGFDPSAPKFFPKINFLMLMKNERLAGLRTRFDDASQTLSINDGGRLSRRAIWPLRKAARQSRHSSPRISPPNCGDRRKSCRRPATASPIWQRR